MLFFKKFKHIQTLNTYQSWFISNFLFFRFTIYSPILFTVSLSFCISISFTPSNLFTPLLSFFHIDINLIHQSVSFHFISKLKQVKDASTPTLNATLIPRIIIIIKRSLLVCRVDLHVSAFSLSLFTSSM